MNNTEPSVATFSSDYEFLLTVDSRDFSFFESISKKLNYSIKRATSDIDGLADHQAVIYDLDLANGNILTAKADILHLKLNSRAKPLILVGRKDFMQSLMGTGSVNHLVDRTVVKPMVSSQLSTVVSSAIKSAAIKRAAIKSIASTKADAKADTPATATTFTSKVAAFALTAFSLPN